MAVNNRLYLLIIGMLMAGCATTGDKSAGSTTETKAGVVNADTASSTTEEQPIVVAMDEMQRQALDTVLDVMRAGEWLTARELMQELIISYPRLAAAYANMGNIHLQLDDTEKAEQAWLKALELRPAWAAVYNQLGIFYRDQVRFEQALAMYQKAIESDESYANSHRNIAILYEIYLGEGEKALEYYRRYRELVGGDEREVLLWVADLERRVKRARK
ncbi:MAG: tetratricopeptide repeat protein [Pseudomonadota bacterium]